MSGFKPRTRKVELYQGDWEQRLEDAARAVEDARASTEPRTLSEPSEAERLAAEHDALREQAIEDRVIVTLQALPRKDWSDLVAKHPPRTDEDIPEHVRKPRSAVDRRDRAGHADR